MPLITVITVVLNGAKYLVETIESVINQTYPNVEYIIIDGGSTDGTLDIIKEYEDKIDYWVSEKDSGIYDAMNKGIRVASGRWIGFLGTGDTYLQRGIENYVNFFSRFQSELYYISSRVELINDKNKKIRVIGERFDWKKFVRYMNIAHVGSLHSRKLFLIFGLFDTNYKISGDYALLLKAGKDLKAEFLDMVTAKMQISGVSNTNMKVFKETKTAKLNFTSRSYIIITLEMYIAIIKWFIRKIILFFY